MSALDKLLMPLSLGHYLNESTRTAARAELAALRERSHRMESCLLWFRDHYKEDRPEETEALWMLEEALK